MTKKVINNSPPSYYLNATIKTEKSRKITKIVSSVMIVIGFLAISYSISNLKGHPTLFLDRLIRIPENMLSFISNRNFGYGMLTGGSVSVCVFSVVAFLNSRKSRPLADNPILKAKGNLPPLQMSWHINQATLKDAGKLTQDPVIKKKVSFLSSNYLAKSAPISPIHIFVMNFLGKSFQSVFQVGQNQQTTYHRTSAKQQLELSQSLNKQFALNKTSPLILLESASITQLLPLNFNVIQDIQGAENLCFQKFSGHFNKFKSNSEALGSNLDKPILINLTEKIGHLIGIKDSFRFENEFESIKSNAEIFINELAKKLSESIKGISKSQFKKFIIKNLHAVCLVNVEEIGGIKVLPLFRPLNVAQLLKKHGALLDFVEQTGTYIGAVSFRRIVASQTSFNDDVQFIPQGKNCIYFNHSDLLNMNAFTNLAKKLNTQTKDKPHLFILGSATLKLIQGLFQEISNERWNEIHQEPALRSIVQTSLFKIVTNLGEAHAVFEDTTRFFQHMELIHCELSNLLEVFRPFHDKDFNQILPDQIIQIPNELRKHIKAGLGKTAVNVFSELNAALIMSCASSPYKVYSHGFYYEQAGFKGMNPFEKVPKKDFKKIDLYAAMFNPNIEIETSHTFYRQVEIEKDISAILSQKEADEKLTVAIDCTTDYANSEKVRNILVKFQREIEKGRLNFIFFRSGQKFDMLGMDNYYGAPYFMVNNGSSAWKNFNTIPQNNFCKTDILSIQWFCLSNKYISAEIEMYRGQIFDNVKSILSSSIANQTTEKDPKKSAPVRVNGFAPSIDPSFIDIKVLGPRHTIRSALMVADLYRKCHSRGIKMHSKASFGFYHINCIVIQVNAVDSSSSIRINPSLDPKENGVIIEMLQSLN